VRALVCREFGALERLCVEQWPEPALADDKARIAVTAAGVSFANTVVLDGRHQNTPEMPFIPGTELAGVVVDKGARCEGIALGQTVVASVPKGAFATHAHIGPRDLYAIPATLDPAVATAIPTLYGTAMGALKWRARVQPGHTVLVLAAGSGTGLAAVDAATMLGARVIACASTDEKLALAGARGARHLINYTTQDIVTQVRAYTDGAGVDVIYDPVGGSPFVQSYQTLKPEGMALMIGFASGEVPSLDMQALQHDNLRASGFYWGFHLGIGRVNGDEEVRARTRALIDDITSAVADGTLRPHISERYPLARGAEALLAVRERRVSGRVTLNMDEGNNNP
tara:strand:+ start:3610 stop:4629 length:1020 start_codon:yes stop_codon:yes gene_type:complete